MKYAVVTGTSRGLGTSIAGQLLKQQIPVIGVSRRENAVLQRTAQENGTIYEHVACDLSKVKEAESVFAGIAGRVFKAEEASHVFLIHNAGTVEPMDTAGSYKAEELQTHVCINLLSPMIVTNLFLEKAEQGSVPLTVVNVTSGAADRSVYGWSAYSSTKAGLNRYTETVALEQDEKGTGNKAILFNPGIMDTEMQQTIRSASVEAFKDVENFRQYKETNRLREPDTVAGVLMDILKEPKQVENGKNYSVYDLL